MFGCVLRQPCILQRRLTQAHATDDIAQLHPPPALNHVRVVLVAPKEEGNIGAVMRLCENFEAYDLCVVAPRCDVLGESASIRSRQSRLLQLTTLTDSLADALAPCSTSVGFTRRLGGGRPVLPSMAALHNDFPEFLTPPAAPDATYKTALVFGREESGLTEEEIGLCSLLCAIPTGRLQPSMNLSHALAVVLSQVFALQVDGVDGPGVYSAAAQAGPAFATGAVAAQRAVLPAALGEVEALVHRLDALGEDVGFAQQGYVLEMLGEAEFVVECVVVAQCFDEGKENSTIMLHRSWLILTPGGRGASHWPCSCGGCWAGHA